MANPIKPKRSYTANSVPLTTDLAQHEMAVNWTDGKLFTKDSSNQIVTLTLGGGGSSYTLPQASATVLGGVKVGSGLAISNGTLSVSDSRWDLFLPPAPTNVSGTAGNAQVSLTWTAPTVLSATPITDYIVQYSSNSGSTWTTFSDGTSTAASATVTGLTNGTAYTFRVAAVNGVGTGSYSTASSSVTPTAGDPQFSNVSLLLHFDGSGSTISDSSGSPKTITAYGNATQSTTQSKFGGKSLYLDGSNSYVSFPSSSAFNFSDFTIEGWVYPTSHIAYATLLEGRTSAAYQNYLCGMWYTNGAYRLDFVTDGGEFQRLTATSTSVELNQWSHFAFVRSGSTLRCYVNGTQDSASVTYSSALNAAASTLTIGKNVDGNYFPGYIDDYRITKYARYTSSFTAPTAAFPDS